jgi:hypothetical protein
MAFGAGLTSLALFVLALCCLDGVLIKLVDHTTRNVIVLFVAPGLLFLFFAFLGRNGQSGRQALAPLLASQAAECWGEPDSTALVDVG